MYLSSVMYRLCMFNQSWGLYLNPSTFSLFCLSLLQFNFVVSLCAFFPLIAIIVCLKHATYISLCFKRSNLTVMGAWALDSILTHLFTAMPPRCYFKGSREFFPLLAVGQQCQEVLVPICWAVQCDSTQWIFRSFIRLFAQTRKKQEHESIVNVSGTTN